MFERIYRLAKGAVTGMASGPAGRTPAEAGRAGETSNMTKDRLRERLIGALRQVFDPEIPVNIYDLGLIYAIDVDETAGKVDVRMTLTAPACPVAGKIPLEVEAALRSVEGIRDVHVELVWNPPWTTERMTDEARLALGLL